MSKVLIAGIGGGKNKETGTYRVANYKIEDKVYNQRSFITSALEEHLKNITILIKLFLLEQQALCWIIYMSFILKNIKKIMMKVIILI